MYNILTLNKIAACGTDQLPKENFTVGSDVKDPAAILVRSADMHSFEASESLLAVGRAGAGVNNIPVDKYADKGIVVFNTPGANANAVKELVIAALLLSSRKISAGINWAQSLAGQTDISKKIEAGKSEFVGPEIYGKKLGVIGLGAIGVLVANACNALGMEVYGFDPFLSVDAAWRLSRSVHKAPGVDAIFADCDYISIHVPLGAETKSMVNADLLAKAKKGVRILNFSRGELVDAAAMKQSVESGDVGCYITDFPHESMLGVEGIIPIPHLGASTPESEDNCAVMAASQVRDFLEYGNIKNSVNYPDCDLPYNNKKRICVFHKNIPNVVGPMTSELAHKNLNIANMINKSKGAVAYTIIDVDQTDLSGVAEKLSEVDGVIRVRLI